MKLVAEQIKYLRDRREELETKKSEYREYLRTRDRTGYDNIGLPQFGSFDSDMEFSKYLEELNEIERTLETSEFVTERNFDLIDIGTLFTISFDGEDSEDIMLVEKGISCDNTRMVSMESDLGKAVFGHKTGEHITYTVTATGRKISVTIDKIKKLKNDYENFIRTKGTASDRMSKRVRKDLKELRESNPEEYRVRHMITLSQASLAREELNKVSKTSTAPSDVAKRTFLSKNLQPENIILPPDDDTIGIGSHVELMLQDDKGNIREMSFELINRAISTELSSHYVERITTLGNAIFGLQAGETFTVIRKNKPRLKGIIKSVDNSYYKEKERVL